MQLLTRGTSATARRHRFRLRWFDYYLLDAKRFVVIVTNMTAMVLLVNNHARSAATRS